MWAQAAFVIPILNGLAGVPGHAVLAVFVLALALAQLSSTDLASKGNFLRRALRRLFVSTAGIHQNFHCGFFGCSGPNLLYKQAVPRRAANQGSI